MPSPLPHARRTAALAAALALGAAAGCGGGGGSSSSGGAVGQGAAGPGAQPGATALSQAHAARALAALGAPYAPGALSLEQAGFDAWNGYIQRAWPEVRKLIDASLDREVRAQVAALGSQGPGGVQVAVRSLAIDTGAAAGFTGSGAGPSPRFGLEVPRAPGAWRIVLEVEATTVLATSVFGVPISTTVGVEATVVVRDVRITQTGRLDCASPARPQIAAVDPTRVDLTLDITSPSPLLSTVLPALTSVLDPALRLALPVGGLYAQREIATLVRQTPGLWQPYGAGAAPAQGVSSAIDLEALADEYSALIQRDLMPFDTVLVGAYTQGGWGNGVVDHYDDYGDSPCWTGHYVMGEAMRYDVTGAPAAQAGVVRALGGLLDCLEVTRPGDGWLSRISIPLSSPEAARIGFGDYQGVVRGVPCAAIGDISRDQYQGALLGVVHAWQRVPAARPRAEEWIRRTVEFCERSDWNVFTRPGSSDLSVSSPMPQSAGFVWAFLSAANMIDPARYGASHARASEISQILWFSTWGSTREVLEEYYKFSLGHDNQSLLFAMETDPARYRDVAKEAEILRDVIGHHDNAWFDAVHASGIPARAVAMGARVRSELERWTLRPRRGFFSDYRNDPTVAKVTYTSPLLSSGPQLVAAQPLAIEKRISGDFLWQQQPFELSGGWPDTRQYPGIDLILPYWLGRAYGVVR